MTIELGFALFGSITGLVGLVFSVISWYKRKTVDTTILALQAYVQLERSVADIPSVLRFHGVAADDLKRIGVTAEEFAYLVANFSAGFIYHAGVTPDDTSPAKPGDYRYNLLESPDTRRAWPLLTRMIGPGKYRDKIEATIRAIERPESIPPHDQTTDLGPRSSGSLANPAA